MKLEQCKFTTKEIIDAHKRLDAGSAYVENKFHPEDDAKTEREILAECFVLEAKVKRLQAS